MKRFARFLWPAVALLLCAAPLRAQQQAEPLLRGRVLLSGDPRKPFKRLSGGVRIKVKNKTVGNVNVPGPLEETHDETWYHRAPLNAHVDVYFSKKGYDLRVREVPRVEQAVHELAPVTLRLTPKPPKRKKAMKKNAPAARGGAASDMNDAGGGGWTGFYEDEDSEDTAAQYAAANPPKPEELLKNLEQQAELARQGELLDIFLDNFSSMRAAYEGQDDLQQVFRKFREDHPEIFKPIGRVTPEHFDSIIRVETGEATQKDLANLKDIIREEALDAGIRGSASVAQIALAPADAEMNAYYSQHSLDPSSPFYPTVAMAVLREGSEAGKGRVVAAVRDTTDQEQKLTLMEALRATAMIEGVEGLSGAASALAEIANSDRNAAVREAAVVALRPFAREGDQTAINALLSRAQNVDETDAVRTEAILALGVGNLEQYPEVRRALTTLASGQGPRDFRVAATLALSGRRTDAYTFADAAK